MRGPALVAAVAAFAAALAGLLWLSAYFIAPPLFGALWRGTPSPWTAQLLAATPAVIVGIPFGVAFGVLPWRRGTAMALAVALVAAGADLALVMRSGIDPSSAPGRAYVVADALFVALFAGAAAAGRRMTRTLPAGRRGWRGAWAWVVLAAATCAVAAWSSARIMPHGV